MRVLVTGGAGFIGANLCRELTKMPGVGHVIALDDLSTGRRGNLDGTDVELVVGSILDRKSLLELVDGVDSVVHLAARPSVPRSLLDPLATHEANATGTLNVLEAARGSECHVIVASSSSVYGQGEQLPKHENLVPRPLSPYAVSKLATEAYAAAYSVSFGLPTIAFRFFNVYGPLQTAGHDYAAVIPSFVEAALLGRRLTVYGDGQQSRDFTHVDSVTRVLADAVLRRVASDSPVNLAFGGRCSLLELVAILQDVLGAELSVRHEPARAGDVRDSQASDERLRELFPGVRPVDLRDGLTRTVDWYRAHLDRAARK